MRLLDFTDDGDPVGQSGDGPPLHIDIRGEIDAELLARVGAQLADHADASELVIHIDSRGGSFGSAFDIFIVIRRHRAARKVAHIRRAESAALLIAMSADERIADPAASILLHSAEFVPDGRWTARQHREAVDVLEWADANDAAIFAYRTGKPAKIFAAAMADEEPAPLSWCLANNIITEIRK